MSRASAITLKEQIVTLYSPRSIRPICSAWLSHKSPNATWVKPFASLIERICLPNRLRNLGSFTFCTWQVESERKFI